MGRAPCCDKTKVKRGPWSPEEDTKLKDYIEKYGNGGNWISLPQKAGLRRCGKSCRLRWLNYLRPNLKHGDFTEEEDRIICSLFAAIGSRWSIIAAQLPGRTDNDIKNYWNTKLRKKLVAAFSSTSSPSSLSMASPPSQNPNFHLKRPLMTQPVIPTYNPTEPCVTTATFDQILISNTATSSSTVNLPNLLSNNSNQFDTFLSNPMQSDYINHYPIKENTNFIMSGGGREASCSSSDGSHGIREIKNENMSLNGGGGLVGYNNIDHEKPMTKEYYGEFTEFDQSYYDGHGDDDDVKQMISAVGANDTSFFMSDVVAENKNALQEKGVPYYHYY